jgi:hypothetical protein
MDSSGSSWDLALTQMQGISNLEAIQSAWTLQYSFLRSSGFSLVNRLEDKCMAFLDIIGTF